MGFFEWIDGKKTYLGGTGAILVGVGKFLYDWYYGTYQAPEAYLSWIIAGWTIIGGRSAAKKL